MIRGYRDHLEYMEEVSLLKALASKPTQFEDAYLTICKRAERTERTDVFLQGEHIINAFSIDESGRRIFYLLMSDVLAKTGATNIEKHMRDLFFLYYKSLSEYSKNFLERYLLEKEEGQVVPKLKARIKEYISNSGNRISRNWINFYIPSELEAVPFNVYSALRNLAVHYLKTSIEPFCTIWLYGSYGMGRKTHIKILCNELNISMLFIDMSKIAEMNDLDSTIDEMLLESLLMGYFICLENLGEFFKQTKNYGPDILFAKISTLIRLCFATSETEPPEKDWNMAQVHIGCPNYEERLRLWECFCKGYAFEENFDIKAIADRFALSPAQIKRAVAEARNISITEGRELISSHYVFECCRRYSTPSLLHMGRLLTPTYSLEDLILAEKQKRLLNMAVERAKFRSKVYEEWAFKEKLAYGRGLVILFYGPSGTGKTMAAQAFAKELELALVTIDLSMVVSKYIGETEKNLKLVFDEAKSGSYILFFDEADSLFGKRTEIKDAHDRNANMEVSYLLQRIEEHDGIVILASNIAKNVDEAFKRRFQFIIDFSLPNEICRKTIWNNVFPKKMPISEDIDYDFLATFRVTGSIIKNCAVTAAFMAASLDMPVDMGHIISALQMENEKGGLGLIIDNFEESVTAMKLL